MPFRDETIVLRDGRRLAYAEWGDAEGVPVFFFHGNPGSRLYCPDEEVTASSRVGLVTVDRPGVGRSDVLAGRTFADWPSDVLELADALGIDQFGVLGWSAGGPYAAACAARIPDRLTAVGIGACRALAQFNFAENPDAQKELKADDRKLFDLAQRDPDAAAAAAAEADEEAARTLWDDPERWFSELRLPEIDQRCLEDPKRRRKFIEAMREGVRQGPEAFAWEQIDAFLPWGFRLADIAIPVHASTASRTRGSNGVTSTSWSPLCRRLGSLSGQTRGTGRHNTGTKSSRRSLPKSRCGIRRGAGRIARPGNVRGRALYAAKFA